MTDFERIEVVERLRQESPESALRISLLADTVEPLLLRIYLQFPAFTEHGRSHSEQVMTYLGWLLPRTMAEPLSARELFYLLSAALLHDIGMADALETPGDEEAQRQIRDSHHLRSDRYVTANCEVLGLHQPEARAVAEICRSHREVDIAESVSDMADSEGTLIRMRLLCAAMRLADELHLTADRVPRLVLDAIQPSAESLAHFKRHLCVESVGPLDRSRGIIQLTATAETKASEKALRQLEGQVQEELNTLAPIFSEYGLEWNALRLNLKRRKVVERAVVLYLAQQGESPSALLPPGVDESAADIGICLEDLKQWHHTEAAAEPDGVRLSVTSHTFTTWLRDFLGTEEEIDFVLSPYVGECLVNFGFADFCERFGAAYDLQETDDRILLLRSSPTALYLLLFAAEFQVESAIIPKRVVLDAAILLGVLTDMFRFPQIVQIRGIEAAVAAIRSKLGQESESQLRLLGALGPDLGRDFREVANEITLGATARADAELEDPVRFSVTVTHTKRDLRRGMSFPHLLKAAMVSGEPLELVGANVRLSSEDPRMAEAVESPVGKLLFLPRTGKLPPVGGVMFCRVDLDHTRKRIALFADVQRSGDYAKYPVMIRMTMSPDRKSATFAPWVYLPHLDVQQALQVDEMFSWLASGDFHRLVVEVDQEEYLPSGVGPRALEALGSELRDQSFQNLLDDAHRDVLRDLSSLQDVLGEPIPLPIALTVAQKTSISELGNASDLMSPSKVREELDRVASQSKGDFTTIRVSTYFPNAELESDEFLGPFPRLPLRIETDSEESSERVARALSEGETRVIVTRGFGVATATLVQQILEGFSEADRLSFLPEELAVTEHPRSMCQMVIEPLEDRMWYREQVIHYQIRDFSAVDELLSSAHQALDKDDAEGAIAVLTDGVRSFPNEPWLPGLLGWAEYRVGDLKAAYEYSEQAVELGPGTWLMPVGHIHYNLGLFSLLRGDFREAMSWYHKGVSGDTGGALDEAIDDLRAEMSAEHPERLYALGFLCEHEGDQLQAAELYREYLSSDSPFEAERELARAAIRRFESES